MEIIKNKTITELQTNDFINTIFQDCIFKNEIDNSYFADFTNCIFNTCDFYSNEEKESFTKNILGL